MPEDRGPRPCRGDGCDVTLPPFAGRGRPAALCAACKRRRTHGRRPTPRQRPRQVLSVVRSVPEVGKPFSATLKTAEAPPDDGAGDGPSPPEPPTPDPGDVDDPVLPAVRRDVETIVSRHPAAESLAAAALALAGSIDSPEVRADPRSLAAAVKELRAVLAEYTREEVAEDDLLAGMSTPVLQSAPVG